MLAVSEGLGTILLIASLLLTAAQLLSRKKPKVATLDDAISTTATQGAYIPLVIGRQRVGPVVCFVEDLTGGAAQAQMLDGPRSAGQGVDGGKGGGSTPTQPSYIERSLHALCVGPASELRAIYQNNERIWVGRLTPVNDPSGQNLYPVVEPDGTTSFFRIYWGFDDDPEIAELGASARHGIATRYTHSVKIMWDGKRLGQTRQWPRLEYEVVCPCYSQIATSPSEIPRTGDDTRPTWQEFIDAGGVTVPAGYTVPIGQVNTNRLMLGVYGLEVIYTGPQVPGISYPGPYPTIQIYDAVSAVDAGIFPNIVDPELIAFFPTGGIIKIWLTNGGSGFPGSPPLSQIGTVGAWRFYRIADSRVITDRDLGVQFPPTVDWISITLGPEIDSGNPVLENVDLSPPTGNMGTDGESKGFVQPLLTGNKDGINPIHLIDQVLFARHPYGAGRNRAKFDTFSIDVAAEQMQAEKIRGGLAIRDGESIESVLSAIMQDIGLFIPLNPDTGLYSFRLLRYETGGPNLGEDVVIKRPEMEHIHGQRPVDMIAFTFKDRDRNYREVPIRVGDNGQISENETVRAEKVPIEITNDRDSVSRLAPRRQQEALGSLSTLRFLCNHRVFLAVPGSRFVTSTIDDPTLVFVITDVKRDVNSSKVQLDVLIDTYDPEGGTTGVDMGAQMLLGAPPESSEKVAAIASLDDYFAVELPRMLSQDRREVELFIGASRRSSATRYARAWVSRDNLTYELLGNTPIVARGTLSDELSATAPAVDEGPVGFESTYDVDIAEIEDLTLSEASWRSGRQVMLVGDEVIFLRNGAVTVPGSPSVGELNGLLRGRAGTKPATHAAGTPFYVFLSHLALKQTSDLFHPGSELYYKVQAAEIRRIEPLDDLLGKLVVPVGLALTPLEPSGLRLGAYQRCYDAAGGAIRFDWCYHSHEYPLTGLGSQPLGDASGISKPLGHFVVRVKDSGDNEVIETTTEEAFFELDKTTRDAHTLDDGTVWTIEVEHVEGSFTSPTASLTVNSF